MTKVYPNAGSPNCLLPSSCTAIDHYSKAEDADLNPMNVLTVWKKSLIFNCEGFTVFDAARGDLVYRVDNYNKADEIFLMDASGSSLLTLRRRKKLMSLVGDSSWLVFDGESADNPAFLVRRNNAALGLPLRGTKSKCQLAMIGAKDGDGSEYYEVEGCYARRCCAVYDAKRRRVAEIRPKEASVQGVAFGNDVFRLVVQPGFDSALAMAVVILLDRIFGSS